MTRGLQKSSDIHKVSLFHKHIYSRGCQSAHGRALCCQSKAIQNQQESHEQESTRFLF
ncbi:hypothetical protein DL89DRAFT_267923 [Linderina pennispora]|uniref:Uncharacterized protein n=1 Tax=Linderina pennispora TaxID=61395 RepID=A0A1Y1W937_9FUNG|nr:uncharacterized protein DL89DRAFT_267923 [Linderina pennispora]ORX69766.1 hypothetical protein DL89DRAFT_267923 [Linderina pennispora]